MKNLETLNDIFAIPEDDILLVTAEQISLAFLRGDFEEDGLGWSFSTPMEDPLGTREVLDVDIKEFIRDYFPGDYGFTLIHITTADQVNLYEPDKPGDSFPHHPDDIAASIAYHEEQIALHAAKRDAWKAVQA